MLCFEVHSDNQVSSTERRWCGICLVACLVIATELIMSCFRSLMHVCEVSWIELPLSGSRSLYTVLMLFPSEVYSCQLGCSERVALAARWRIPGLCDQANTVRRLMATYVGKVSSA